MLSWKCKQEAQNFRYLKLPQIISLLQMKSLSVESHMTQATQWDSAGKTAEMLFWANANLTIEWSCNSQFRALNITRILHMDGNQEHIKLYSPTHPLS